MSTARAMAPPALVLFAKTPVAGRVKTRLRPGVTAQDAAALGAALLSDTADVLRATVSGREPPCQGEAAELGPRLYCAAAEPEDEEPLRRLLPGFGMVPQGSGDLGDRLARVLGSLLAIHPAAVALGTDCPDLTPALVRAALKALGRTREGPAMGDRRLARAVLGPAEDGGYWAIGLTEARPELFLGIPWSTPVVLETTRARLASLALPFEELPVLRDLDRLDDVKAWAAHPNPAFGRTLAWCRERELS